MAFSWGRASGIPTLCHLIPSQEQPDTQTVLEVTLCAPERIKNSAETSLEVQWLRPRTSTARGRDSIPSWGSKIPHAPWLGQNQTNKKTKQKTVRGLVCSPWLGRGQEVVGGGTDSPETPLAGTSTSAPVCSKLRFFFLKAWRAQGHRRKWQIPIKHRSRWVRSIRNGASTLQNMPPAWKTPKTGFMSTFCH